jgi:surfactin synthase thioesterase subunit/phosphopantetheinyl transferase
MNQWVLPLKLNPGARLRLILLPHSGGGARGFSQWPARLPEDIEVLAVQLPGREERFGETPFSRMWPLIETLMPALAQYLDASCVLFGHSLGALIAFELARACSEQKLTGPAHVIVSGHAAAHLPRDTAPMHSLPEAEFLERLRLLEGTPPEVLGHQEVMRTFLPLLRADLAVGETYAYAGGTPLDCPLTVYGGADDPMISAPKLEAWKSLTSGPFQMRLIPGGHFYLKNNDLFFSALADDLRNTNIWRKPTDPVHLQDGEVHLWRARLGLETTILESLLQSLSAEECRRAAAFHFQKHRDRFIASHGFLRQVLASYLGIEPAQVAFRLGSAGKPELADDQGIRFNLSHSGSGALLGVTRGGDIGVDIEEMRPMPDALQLAKRFFSPAEGLVLQGLKGDPLAFLRCWTRKEAYMKARGLGLSLGLERFEVAFSPGEPARLLRMEGESDAPSRWWLADVPLAPDFVGACAVERGPCRLRFWDWESLEE